MPIDKIKEILIRLNNEIADFKQELCKISWYMRGGVLLNDLMFLYSVDDRDAMYSVIKENIDNTKETRMPLI